MNTIKIGVGQLWDEGDGRFLLDVESVALSDGRTFDDADQVLAILRRGSDGALTLDERATWGNCPIDLNCAINADRIALAALMLAHAEAKLTAGDYRASGGGKAVPAVMRRVRRDGGGPLTLRSPG